MCLKRAFHISLFGLGFFRQREGFTIVELVVVIMVISVFAGVVGVSVDQVNENTRLSNAATRALADVRYAQELALANRREVDVYVTSGADKYEVKWHDTGGYVVSPVNDENLIVQFNQGDYHDVSITSSGLGGRLSFSATGEPLINGSPFSSPVSVMLLNSRIHVVIYSSGFSALEEVVGGSTSCGSIF